MAKIALINLANADVSALSDIVAEADLPAGEIRLIVGDPLLSDEYQAVTMARAFIRHAGNLWGLEQFLSEPWDCGVVIGRNWAARQAEFPAYFAYLLGHELGHATTVLTDLVLTIYQDIVRRCISKASSDRRWRWDDMPYETTYDQFGMAVAEIVCGRACLEDDFGRILSGGLSQDEPRLRKALDLPPCKDLRGLWADLASFALPYRHQLLDIWQQEREFGRLRIADGLPDLNVLWRRNGDCG